MSHHEAQKHVKKMREKSGMAFFSTLEQVRQRANLELEACAKDEKRTREYLHRAKLHCSLVLHRRKEKNALLGGGTQGDPMSPERPSSNASGRSSRQGSAAAAATAEVGGGGANARGREQGDDVASQAGSIGSRRAVAQVPISSSHGWTNHHGSPAGKVLGDGGDNDNDNQEDLAKQKAKLLRGGPANTLKQDRKAIEAIAHLEGPVEFEYKIPPGATWSEHVSTMSREWCDFVLNKPNRIWNWDDKLERIREHVAGGMDEQERVNVFKDLLSADKGELDSLSKKMLTLADVQQMKRQRRFAKACEESLEKMFEDIALKVAAMSTAGASMGIDVSLLKAKPIDMREFSLLLTNLELVPDKISKTEAQHFFMETKEAMSKVPAKDLGYQHFKVAFKRVCAVAGVSLSQVLGVTESKERDKEKASERDPIEEKVVSSRDLHTVAERLELKRILEEMDKIAEEDKKSQQEMTPSTWGDGEESPPQSSGGEVERQGKRGQEETEEMLLLEVQEEMRRIEERAKMDKDAGLTSKLNMLAKEDEITQALSAAEVRIEAAKSAKKVNSRQARKLDSQQESALGSMRPGGVAAAAVRGKQQGSRKALPSSRSSNAYEADANDATGRDQGDWQAEIARYDDFVVGIRNYEADRMELEEMSGAKAVNVQDAGGESDRGDEAEQDDTMDKEMRAKLLREAQRVIELHACEGGLNAATVDLIGGIFESYGVSMSRKDMTGVMLQARNPGHALKQDIMHSLQAGNNRNAILGLLRAMKDPADDYHVMPLMRKVLRKIKSDIPTPSTHKSWVSSAAGVVKISLPPDVLVGQGIAFTYNYRNPEAERMSKAWKLSHQGSDLPPLDRLVGGPETFKKDLEERNERQLEDAKRSFWGKDAERLFLQRSESSSQHPPGDWIAICRVPFSSEEEDASHLSNRKDIVKNEDARWQPVRSEGGNVVHKLSATASRRRSSVTSNGSSAEGGGALPEAGRGEEDLDGKANEGARVAVGGDQDKDFAEKMLSEEERMDWNRLNAQLDRLEARDLVVSIMTVPTANDGNLVFPTGIEFPGTYQLKYYMAGSSEPLSVSRPFRVSFPVVKIECPQTVEIGRPFVVDLTLVNFDFENADDNYELPRNNPDDWLGIYSAKDKARDVPMQTCYWKCKVGAWLDLETTSVTASEFLPPGPGDYEVHYHLAGYGDQRAGSSSFAANFPRRSANHFETLQVDLPSMRILREVRVFFSMDLIDMRQEAELIDQIWRDVQAHVDEFSITVTCVYLPLHFDDEEEYSKRKDAVRRSLEEIDRCRPFFVGSLGERYGYVPAMDEYSEFELDGVKDDFPWLKGVRSPHIPTGLGYTLTELEFLYSMLHAPRQAARSLIFFRDVEYIHTCVPSGQRDVHFPAVCGETTLKRAKSAMQDLKMRLKGMCQLLAVKNLGVFASDDGTKLHWGDGIHQRRLSMERRGSFRRVSVSKDNKDARERRPSLLQRLISHERGPPKYEEGGDTPPGTPGNNQDGSNRGKSASSSIMDAVSKQGGFSDSMGTRPATSELSTPMNAGTPGGTPDGKLRPRIFLKKITHAKANFDLRVASVKPQVYVKPETWAHLVSQGLKDRIMSDVIHDKAPDAVERAGMITDTLTRSYRLLLDEKLVAETMDEIDAELQKETGYISVAGGKGCGKTTLLSAWMKRHVDRCCSSLMRGSVTQYATVLCPEGPSEQVQEHLFISTFIDSPQVNPTMEGVLRRLIAELKKHNPFIAKHIPSDIRIEHEVVEWLQHFLGTGSEVGLIWLIDGLDKMPNTDFAWLKRIVTQVKTRLRIIVSVCTSDHQKYLNVTNIVGEVDYGSVKAGPVTTTSQIEIPKLTPGSVYTSATFFMSKYDMETDDGIVEAISTSSNVASLMHLQMLLVGVRLMAQGQQGLTGRQVVETLLELHSAEQVFVHVIKSIKEQEPVLTEILIYIALSQRGMREGELHSLIGFKFDTMRRIRDILIDEMCVTFFGVLDFQSSSMKLALRESYRESTAFWDEGRSVSHIEALTSFFSNVAPARRRSCELPHLMCMHEVHEGLFNLLSNSNMCSLLVELDLKHMMSDFLTGMQLTAGEYVASVELDFQNTWGSKDGDGGGRIANERANFLQRTLRLLFIAFSRSKDATSTGGTLNTRSIKSNKFSSLRSLGRNIKVMDISEFLSCIDWLELLNETRSPNLGMPGSISKKDATRIFEMGSVNDADSSMTQSDFRWAIVQIAKRIGVQVSDMISACICSVQVRELFKSFAAAQSTAAVAGAVGKRSRTIDFKEYTLLLEHLGLYKKMTRFEAHQIFKKANRADDGDGDNAELVLGEFRQCMELIAQHVAEPLIDLLGKDLSVILQVKSDDAEGMKDNQAEKRVTVDLSKVTPEELLKYTTDSMNIVSMFCQIGQDGSSIDILQLMLTSIYGVEAFAEIADRSTSVVYGAHIEVVYFFSLYADICLRRANTLIENERSARYSLAGLQKSFEEIQSREAQRRKELTGGGKRLSASERKHEEEQRTRYAKTVSTFEQDISNAEQDAHDAAQELRWLRRRSAIARAAAQRLRISSKHKEEKSILQDLLSTFANSSLAPQTRWAIAQENLKEIAALGRSASTEGGQEEFEFSDTNWNVEFTRRPTADGWVHGENDDEEKKDDAEAPVEAEDVTELSAQSAAKMLGKSALIASSLGFSAKSNKGRKQPPALLAKGQSPAVKGGAASTFATLGRRRLMATSGSDVAASTSAASDPAAAFESSFAKRLASLEESFSAKASPSKGSRTGQSPSKGSTMRSRSGSQVENRGDPRRMSGRSWPSQT